MPKVLLTYDIKRTSDTIHTELKNRLIQHYGYSPKIISGDNRNYDLPNTTLRKDNITSQQGASDFVSACRDVRATWERYVASEYSAATFANN